MTNIKARGRAMPRMMRHVMEFVVNFVVFARDFFAGLVEVGERGHQQDGESLVANSPRTDQKPLTSKDWQFLIVK